MNLLQHRNGLIGTCIIALWCVGVGLPGCGTQDNGGGGNGGNGLTLTVTISPAGSGQVSRLPDQQSYTSGDTVMLTAAPANGYAFDHWTGGASGTANPLQVTLQDNLTIQAVFVPKAAELETIVSEQTKVVPETVNINTTDTNLLELSGSDLPTLHPGNIIVSSANGGVLARVRAVDNQGGVVTLETEPASLTDIIQQGRAQLTGQLDMTRAQLRVPTGNFRAAKIAIEDGALVISDLQLEIEDKATVTVGGHFSFSPNFEFQLDIEDWAVQYFLCAASGEVGVGLDAEVEVTALTEALLQKEVTIVELTWPEPAGILVIGGVPVMYEFFLNVKLGAGVSAGELGTVGAGFDLDAALRLGADYDRSRTGSKWSPIAEVSFDADADAPDMSLHPIVAKVYLEPEFGIKFFKVVGPSLSYKESLELAGDYKFDELGVELRNGHTLDLNFTFDIVDKVKFQLTQNLYDDKNVLMSRLAFAADPTQLGTIDYSPTGLAGFYWHTLAVTAEGEPASGYEVAGYSIRHLLDNNSRVEKVAILENEPADASKLITAHFVPAGEGDNWDGSGINGSEGNVTVTVEVWPPDAGRVILFPTFPAYSTGGDLIIQALANDGFVFHHWQEYSGFLGTDPVMHYTIPGNTVLRAVFGSDPPRHLNVPADYPTIQAALDAATYGDIIELAEGTYTGDGNRDLQFDDRYAVNITISGQGCDQTIIDLEGSVTDPHRLSMIRDVEGFVRWEALTIRNGYADADGMSGMDQSNDGGALHIPDSQSAIGIGKTSLEIDACCFENCAAEGDGGAVFFGDSEEGQHLNITNSSFTGCGGGGAVWVESGYQDIAVVIDGSTFTGSVSNAFASSELQGTLRISASQFVDNGDSAIKLHMGWDVEISDCEFSGNHAQSNGGAINTYRTKLWMHDCTFADNSAGSETSGYGGAVSTGDTVVDEYALIENCSFTGNSTNIGGAVSLGEAGVLRDCTFDGNSAVHDGGALYLAGKAFDCTFTNNTAGDSAGAVYLAGGTLEGSTLTDNTARYAGGAVDTSSSGGTLSACTIQGNSAAGPGGVRANNALIRNCFIIDNESTENDTGGMSAYRSSVYACTIGNNHSVRGRGGLDADECLVSGCVIEHNTAAEEGGGITARASTITSCTVRNNSAASGAGIQCWDDETRIYESVFTDNSPDECLDCVDCTP